MSNEVQLFNHEEFGRIRTVTVNGTALFVVNDVCKSFGATNPNRLLASLEDDEKGYTQIETPGGIQNMAVVNEAGLYALLFALQPNKAKARGVSSEEIEARIAKLKAFKRWVTHEVLPSIRRTGGYMVAIIGNFCCSMVNKGIYLGTIERRCEHWCFQQRSDTTRRTSFATLWPSTEAPILNSSRGWKRRKAGTNISRALSALTSKRKRGRSSSRSPRNVTPCFTWRLASVTDMKGVVSC